MKYFGEFFNSISWWTLRPDDNLLAAQAGGNNPAGHVSASRSERGDLALVYLSVGGELRLRPGILADGLTSEWFDPRTGGRSPATPQAPNTFRASEEQDWVLVLRPKN